MNHVFLKFGHTVATVATGILLAACGSESDPELSATSPATVRLALVSVPSDVVCVRARVKGASRSVTRDFTVSPGNPSNFSLSGLPSGEVSFDVGAYSLPCVRLGKDPVPSWVGDSQTVVLTTGAVTRVSVTLRPSAAADVTADFVPDTGGPSPVGAVQFSPSFVDFGGVAVGETARAELKLLNNTGGPTQITSFSSQGGPDIRADVTDCAKPLLPMEGCLVKLTFSPKTAMLFTSELVVEAGSTKTSATVSGSGILAP